MTSWRSFADASDEQALAKRNTPRRASSHEPGDKGKQNRVIQVFPAEARSSSRASTSDLYVRQGQPGLALAAHRDHRNSLMSVWWLRPRSAFASVSAGHR